ncbi:unnamed protein product [Symbiodinium sp. CCMP2592]|nr:unnamed protein product [Symbiodinium sp. CCMP2592]CAE7822120.1 unnamed protein product [Symbiodinium sp. CCMP2592]
MPSGRKKPSKKKSSTRRLGKASTLPGALWGAWLDHVLRTGPTWLWVALVLSHCLCLRISEVLRLRRRDFRWEQNQVYVGPLKQQPGVRKSMLTALVPVLRNLRDHGKSRRRKQHKGARGTVAFADNWAWPKDDAGFLFPSTRSDSAELHRVKDSACKAVSRARQSFKPSKKDFVQVEQIRTHSGRHRMINDLKQAEVPQEIAMKFARISDVRTFIGYGELTDEQAGKNLQDNKTLQKRLVAVYSNKRKSSVKTPKSKKK